LYNKSGREKRGESIYNTEEAGGKWRSDYNFVRGRATKKSTKGRLDGSIGIMCMAKTNERGKRGAAKHGTAKEKARNQERARKKATRNHRKRRAKLRPKKK